MHGQQNVKKKNISNHLPMSWLFLKTIKPQYHDLVCSFADDVQHYARTLGHIFIKLNEISM